MINDLILRATYEGVTTDLDVDGDVPLRVDISQVDNQDIGEVYGVSSQKFNLPGTNTNNKFFNHAYLESAIDVPAMYDTIDCSVIRNGETLILGNLQLNEVVTSGTGYITYDVSVSNKVVEFNEELKDKFFYQANFDDLNHTLNTDNVFASWLPRSQSTFENGAIFYPLVDYGFDDRLSFPTVPRLSSDFDSTNVAITGSTASQTYPLTLAQFLPAIGVREVFDKIFDQAGYAYTSSLIESEEFDELFVLFKNSDGLGVLTGQTTDTANLYSGSISPAFTLPAVPGNQDIEYIVPFSGSLYDPGSNFSTTTFYYSAPKSGNYTFASSLIFDNSSTSTGAVTDFFTDLTIDRTGSGIPDDYYSLAAQSEAGDTNGDEINLIGGTTQFMTEGDRAAVAFTIDNLKASTATDPTILKTTSLFQVTSAPLTYQDLPVSMSLQIDDSIKTIDLFKGLLTQFNLVAYAEQEQSKTIRLETFDTWMRIGDEKDWTEKYNTAKRISIKNPVGEEPRELLFSNVDDTDRISTLSKDQTPNFQYGTLRTLSNSNLTSGEKKVQSLFSPSPLAPVVTALPDANGAISLGFSSNGRFVIPHFYKFKNNSQESFKFKPKIGYRTYYKTGNTRASDLYAPANQFMVSGSDTVPYTDYSTLSNYASYPVSSSTPDLLFNSAYTKYGQDELYPTSGSSNFNNYWKEYINSIYWEDGRKVVMDLFFEEYEYQDIKLNDQIIINNNRYRINKIKGFNLTRRDIVTVEMLKLYPVYAPVIETTDPVLVCPVVETYPPALLTSSSLTMSGSVISSGSLTVTERGFVLSTSDSTPTITDTVYKTGSGQGLFDYPLSGLTPDTTYYHRAYASSSLCLEYGSINSTTTPTASCPVVVTYNPALLTSQSFTMSGSVVSSDETVVERGFVLSTSDSTPTIGEGATKYPTGSGLGLFDYPLAGLNPGTIYYHRGYASSSLCLEYGVVKTTTTLTSSICPTVTTASGSIGGPYTLSLYAATLTTGSGIVERGFTVSPTDTSPEIGETNVFKVVNATGSAAEPAESWNNTITSASYSFISASQEYYFRSYVSASGCVGYSNNVLSGSTSATGSAIGCTPFSSSATTNFLGACSETINQQLWTDYSGSWPFTQTMLDAGLLIHAYTDADCTTVPSQGVYYAFDSGSASGTSTNVFLRILNEGGDAPGKIGLVQGCGEE